MKPCVLTLNAGSSSLKAALFPPDGDLATATVSVENLGGPALLVLRGADGRKISEDAVDASTCETAMPLALGALHEFIGEGPVAAVGHRVVHGGPDHALPCRVDDALLEALERYSPMAPLHQPHNLAGIRAAMRVFPGVPQVVCFDTAFHRQHPWVNDTFALPREWYERGIRRYGFHGLSYDYVTGELARIAPRLAEARVVIAHLGGGSSLCAIHGGRAVASTMGFSALDGLPMGTRCGQLDPGVVLYLMQQEGMTVEAITEMLYRRSGMLGLSGLTSDMRTLEASDSPAAREAIEYYVFRIQRELGGMAAAMGGIDTLVFCGGIGENSALIRARVCERLAWIGVELDHGRNRINDRVISSEFARTTVMVIPTNEELVIARGAREAACMP